MAARRRTGQSVALVPTMGALHEGHLELVRRARRAHDCLVVSLFVNPLQFNRNDDLTGYPRDEDRDRALLARAGVDILYAPEASAVYPQGFATTIRVAGVSEGLCGATRPGHFEGVATVVAKLLIQVAPEAAYFGEKDYQQLLVVRRLVCDLDLPVEIVAVPTVRDADGLALSSRNQRLTPAGRRLAPRLYEVLCELKPALLGGAEADPLLERASAALIAAGFESIDYLELRDGKDLAPLTHARAPARLFVAAWLEGVRLIDNLEVI